MDYLKKDEVLAAINNVAVVVISDDLAAQVAALQDQLVQANTDKADLQSQVDAVKAELQTEQAHDADLQGQLTAAQDKLAKILAILQ